MTLTIQPFRDEDLEALGAMTRNPSISPEFEKMQGPHALEGILSDPFMRPSMRWLAFVSGAPAAFCYTFVLPGWEGVWVMVRIGVLEHERRRGIGTALLERAVASVREQVPECGEICLSAWLPNPAASGFAERHGFRHARHYWMMERPLGAVPEVAWPEGIEARVYDGSDRALSDWNEVYNRSFAEHYHGIQTTVEDCRWFFSRPDVDPKSLMLAYRNGRCVGFCRNDLRVTRGEVSILGVDPEARGIGLGRALLRWGALWLTRAGAPRVTLNVDGENETALRLYRSEGFEVVKTRSIWTRTDF